MTRIPVVPSPPRRPVRALLVALAALVAAGTAGPPPLAAADAPEREVTKPLAPSNTALLAKAAEGAARQLVARVPLTPGTRVGLRGTGDSKLDADMREALLQALNARRITCVLLPAAPGGDTTAGAPAGGPGGGGPGASAGPSAGSNTDLAALARQAEQARSEYEALQSQRGEQAARGDSARAAAPAGAPASALATPADLPILTWRVQEARVDYVRQFRGGLLGAHRVERRARADLALRLTPAGSDAVAWSAAADSTVGDVVLKAELAALEDRTRVETRPQLPQSSFKKVLEPLLVVVLIAGLVSLFYQNRP